MRRGLWVAFWVTVGLATVIVDRACTLLDATSHDTEEMLFPDPREREEFRLEFFRNAVQGYAGAHRGALPAELEGLIDWLPSDARAVATRSVVDIWGTPVLYYPAGAAFTLRSAGPDRAWRTADDVVLSGPDTSSRPPERQPRIER